MTTLRSRLGRFGHLPAAAVSTTLASAVPLALGTALAAAVGVRRALPRRVRPTTDANAPRGSGPVVLVGGFCVTEQVLAPLRDWLMQLGYDVLTHTATAGMGCGGRSVDTVRATLRQAAARDGDGVGVRVVGYSRGGQFARVAVRDADVPIRALVTLGTPFDPFVVGPLAVLPAAAVAVAGSIGATGLASLSCLSGDCCKTFRRGLLAPVDVPFTSVYSRRDAMVPWRSARDGSARNVEISGCHLGLLDGPDARAAVAEALAA